MQQNIKYKSSLVFEHCESYDSFTLFDPCFNDRAYTYTEKNFTFYSDVA